MKKLSAQYNSETETKLMSMCAWYSTMYREIRWYWLFIM